MPDNNTAGHNRQPYTRQTYARPATLDDQYRAIGISAVAAAVRYRPEPQRPAVIARHPRDDD